MTEHLRVEALSTAALVRFLRDLPHDGYYDILALENGTPWARLKIKPTTDTLRSVFPLYSSGATGDTRKTGHRGVFIGERIGYDALSTVINRARRMFVPGEV